MTAVQERPAAEIGRDRRRKEDQRLITGRTRWTDNIALPGMLHMAMVRTPFAHATITGIETSAAKAASRHGPCPTSLCRAVISSPVSRRVRPGRREPSVNGPSRVRARRTTG